MSARDLDQLAARLGRPATGMPALRELSPEQIARLSELIDVARARRRAALDEALANAVPLLPRALTLRLLGGERR